MNENMSGFGVRDNYSDPDFETMELTPVYEDSVDHRQREQYREWEEAPRPAPMVQGPEMIPLQPWVSPPQSPRAFTGSSSGRGIVYIGHRGEPTDRLPSASPFSGSGINGKFRFRVMVFSLVVLMFFIEMMVYTPM